MTDILQPSPSRQKRQLGTPAIMLTLNPNAYVVDTGLSNWHYISKRFVDLSLSFLALLILAPVFLLIALLILIDSRGPIFYTQKRVGTRRVRRDGEWVWEQFQFKMYKFRTMRDGASNQLHRQFIQAYIHNDEPAMKAIKEEIGDETKDSDAAIYKIGSDPRITRIGKFLRKTSFDELPQIFNVLRGQMSLVGPRPALPYEVKEYKLWHKRRFAAYQGITGYWQVTARSEVSFDKMVELDVWYAKHQSLFLDFKIMLLTPLKAIQGKGAE
jgi:lipopolysaccharide/colanic/teichoic acid biosynthesis glycosyltransferase